MCVCVRACLCLFRETAMAPTAMLGAEALLELNEALVHEHTLKSTDNAIEFTLLCVCGWVWTYMMSVVCDD